jgi:hypothetical protein
MLNSARRQGGAAANTWAGDNGEDIMSDDAIFELPLTAKAHEAFATIRRSYQISDAEILEILIDHLATLSPPQQKQLMDSVLVLGKINLFPVNIPRSNTLDREF